MKCEKCGNEYQSQYYFATPTICKECYSKLTPEEQQIQTSMAEVYAKIDPYTTRQGFGIRLGAYILDIVIEGIIVVAVLFGTGLMKEVISNPTLFYTDPQFIKDFTNAITPISLIITFMYYSLEIVFASTPGKMILGLVIANENRTGASTMTLFNRFALKHSSSIVSVVSLLTAVSVFGYIGTTLSIVVFVGCFWALSQKRQAFHDMIAKTAVYKKSDILNDNNATA